MIQMNLLPKVKLEYIKTSRNKKLVQLGAILATAISLAIIFILFMVVNVVQSKYSRDLSADIKVQTDKLKGITDLDKILTIQRQLNSLEGLHDSKPVTSRLFGYIQNITPDSVSISEVQVDFEAKTIQISGEADSLGTVNKFVDTLKFTRYLASEAKSGEAFSEVVLVQQGLGQDGATYQITAKYHEAIFLSNNNATLEVPPGKITTRSQTEKPTELFKPSSTEPTEGTEGED